MIENAPFRERVLDDAGMFSRGWVLWLTKIGVYGGAVSNSGTARPTENLFVGMPHFDETLGIPIWVKTVSPVVWVDATGASV